MNAFDRLLLLFPLAFVAHVAEEAPGFTRWAQAHARRTYSQRDFVRNNLAGLVLTVAGTWAVRRRRGVGPVYAGVFTQQAVGNAVFHLASGAPGTATAVGVVLPAWLASSLAGLRAGVFSGRGLAVSVAAGGAVHALAVRSQVYGR